MQELFLRRAQWMKIIVPMLLVILSVGCGDDEDDPVTPAPVPTTQDPIASFQFEVDAVDFLKVQFSNFSQNASTYAWDFGDGNTSTQEAPSHTYGAGGTYTVVLTASEGSASTTRSETLTVTDPNDAARALTGTTSKTWKLFREGTSMSLGPDVDNPTQFWGGLTNDGSRTCLYEQEITFHTDGTYEFDDKGMFWAEFGVFNNVTDCDTNVTAESCFDSTAENMVNACGDDVSAWGSGSHTFEYNPTTSSLTLNGMGAWIGIPKLGTTGETITPVGTTSTQVTITQNQGFDVMLVEFIWGDLYWPIQYASYSDPSLEPELVSDFVEVPFGEDFPDSSPTALFNSFADVSTASIDTIQAASLINYGAADPAGGAELVGEFIRTEAQFQELQFQTSPEKSDINFENLTSVSVDVYFPSSNDYTGSLSKNVIVGLADKSQTEQWWTDQQEFIMDGAAMPEDEWVTINFDLNTPSFVNVADNGATPYERNDYDMIYLQIGSGDHSEPGVFFVRNLSFE